MDEIRAGRLRAPSKPHANAPTVSITRRQLLAGTGKVALVAMLPLGCAPGASIPFADGTFWDDGSGWLA